MVLKAVWEEGHTGRLSGPFVEAPCAFGRSGVTTVKKEGDGASPLGRYVLRACFWRPDRGKAPRTRLPLIPIRRDLGWCDDPGHPLYNRAVRLPFPASHEKMWREDRAYDLVVLLSHNLDRPVPGAGSAVFFHLTKGEETAGPTEGCIAVSPQVMRAVLARAHIGTLLSIEGP